MSELGVNGDLFEAYAKDTLKVIHENGKLFGRPSMSAEDIVEVVRSAL